MIFDCEKSSSTVDQPSPETLVSRNASPNPESLPSNFTWMTVSWPRSEKKSNLIIFELSKLAAGVRSRKTPSYKLLLY